MFAAFVPSQGRTLVDLTTGPMLATVTTRTDAAVLTFADGVQVVWRDGQTDRSHWLPGPGDALGGAALLEADADHVVLAALPAAGNRLLTQVRFRRGGASCRRPPRNRRVTRFAYWGAFTSCGTFVDDLDGDGDRDRGCNIGWRVMVSGPQCSRSLAPELLGVTHDASRRPAGGISRATMRVPAGWDFQAFPDLGTAGRAGGSVRDRTSPAGIGCCVRSTR
ncbi:MAG: hypothetical protein IPK26_28525 [Planctomycetes bacterium]|nr:hypothetical protein [Planctomycetota bacterium]